MSAPEKLFRAIVADWRLVDAEVDRLRGLGQPGMKAVIATAAGAASLYRDPHTIREWLNEPTIWLDGASPRAMLTAGHLGDVDRVLQYVEYLCGR